MRKAGQRMPLAIARRLATVLSSGLKTRARERPSGSLFAGHGRKALDDTEALRSWRQRAHTNSSTYWLNCPAV